MSIENDEVAAILQEIGDMLEIRGEMRFKVRAYHRAAASLRALAEDVNKALAEDRLEQIPAIGRGLAQKIAELLTTGKMAFYEDLKEAVPTQILELMRIPGLGPKKAKLLYETLGVTTIDELEQAIEEHKLRALKGMTGKTEENILRGIGDFRHARERILLFEALPISERILNEIRRQPFVKQAEAGGSLRRKRETIGDIDLLVATDEPQKVMDFFCEMAEVRHVLARGDKKSSVIVKNGLQIDVRAVAADEYGAALQYFTGSKEHNVRLRDRSKRSGFKINEYGVFRVDTGERLGGRWEEEIYNELGLDFIPPVLREDKGEIEAAEEHRLPNLVKIEDIKGDLHCHSRWSDGLSKIAEMAEAAAALGYEYICLSDHAEKLKVAGGLTPRDLAERQKEIDKLNGEFGDRLAILSGAELNIDNDGTVDYKDPLLETFDVVTASVHKGFNQSRQQLTERTIRAMESRHIDIIGHPTGRILGKRPPFALDIEKVLEAAADTGTVLELNSFPDRLDLRDGYLREGKTKGVKFAINTDAHLATHLRYISYGISMAQRGWLEPEDVINTYPLEKLRRSIKS